MYSSFFELARDKEEDVDYSRSWSAKDSQFIIIAPHGSGIEPGTAKLAQAIAGDDYSYYVLEGIQPSGNDELHIDSHRFDDPDCLQLLDRTPLAIAIHGCVGTSRKVFVGGRNGPFRTFLISSLNSGGFHAEIDRTNHAGLHPSNICNKCASGAGVQFEITEALRTALFRSLSRRGREHPTRRFNLFVEVARSALEEFTKDPNGPGMLAG